MAQVGGQWLARDKEEAERAKAAKEKAYTDPRADKLQAQIQKCEATLGKARKAVVEAQKDHDSFGAKRAKL